MERRLIRMVGNFYLAWASMAVSLANAIILGWLGLTVLLNAEWRTRGVWLAGCGLLVGAAFFISHSAILGLAGDAFSRGLNLFWRFGWLPLITSPLAWYVMVLWHVGFWDRNYSVRELVATTLRWQSAYRELRSLLVGWGIVCWYLGCWEVDAAGQARALRRRHRWGLYSTAALFGFLLLFLLLMRPLPSFIQALQWQGYAAQTVGGFAILLLIFSLYSLLSIGLALDALRRPAPSIRLMGDLARQRARPWLVAATTLVLMVCLLISAAIGWVPFDLQQMRRARAGVALSWALVWLDLIINLLLLGAICMVGQAVIAYEIFTGATLPRRELQRHWQNILLLALGLGLAVGLSFARQSRPLYSLFLVVGVTTLFYALLVWRAFRWREAYVHQLRPFLGSQQLYDRLLQVSTNGAEPPLFTQALPDLDITALFATLCTDVLNVRLAYLVAVGPISPLMQTPLIYPPQTAAPELRVAEMMAALRSTTAVCLPLDPQVHGGLLWAVPLWSARGLVGLFLLGSKQDDGLFTQEEMEIARASGERLLDTRASAELARTLLALQRQRLVESQLLDRRTRRVIHDDILPQVHAALLALSTQAAPSASQATELLVQVHQQLADLLHEMPARGAPVAVGQGLVAALHHLLAEELRDSFDSVTWQVAESTAERLTNLPPLTAEVLFYASREAIRNAARHGRGGVAERLLNLRVDIISGDEIQIRIEDDGIGIQPVVASPTSTQQGLALHRAMLAVVGGYLEIIPLQPTGTQVVMMIRL